MSASGDGEPASCGLGRGCVAPAVVRIVDSAGGSDVGCEQHGADALRAIVGAKVYPLPGRDDAAIRVYQAANSIRS